MPFDNMYGPSKMASMQMHTTHNTYSHMGVPDYYPSMVYKRRMVEQSGQSGAMIHYTVSSMDHASGVSPYPCQASCCYPEYAPLDQMGMTPMSYMGSYLP